MEDKTVSPKIEIINHFDNLINRVDIDIEESLEKYNEEQVLGDLKCYKSYKKNEIKSKRRYTAADGFRSFELNESSLNRSYENEIPWLKEEKKLEETLLKHRTNENPDDLEYDKIYKTVDLWSESTKVVDYLNQVRMRTIEELREAQKEALANYKSQSSDSNVYFQVRYTQTEPEEWIFKLFTFVTDFYMSPKDISLFEKLINAGEDDFDLFVRDSETIFDEKMIFIGLLQKHFFENLKSEKFPSPVINVCKQDFSNIKQIKCCYNISEVNLTGLSNLESLYFNLDLDTLRVFKRINLNGLSSVESLRLKVRPLKCLENLSIRIRNLPSLLHLDIYSYKNPSKFLDYFPTTIEYLSLGVTLSNFSLDSLVNLKSLSLSGIPDKDFNFDLFKNICNKLVVLKIDLVGIDNKFIDMMFLGHSFPILNTLSISSNEGITKIKKKWFVGFPMLQSLIMRNNFRYSVPFGTIETEAFSDLKQLISLDLSGNRIHSLKRNHFSGLDKLKYLNLSHNRLEKIEENLFSSLKNLRTLDLSENEITKLNANSFDGLNNMKVLDLKQNKLKHFDLRILDYIGQVELIDLSKNTKKDDISNRSNIKFIF